MELKSQTKANEKVWCQLYTNCLNLIKSIHTVHS